MPAFLSDLHYGLRKLCKTPGFTTVCVLTLGLGIGANTAVFSVMNAVLLRSLPVADPQRIVYLHTSNPPQRTGTVDFNDTFSYAVFDVLRQQHRGLAQVMAYAPLSTSKVAVRFGAEPEEAEGDMVSGNFFLGLGVRMARGRGFTAHDEESHAPIAVISYDYWTSRFLRNPDVLGERLFVKGVPLTIVGVAAEGFEGLEAGASTNFWIPLQNRAELNAWGNPPENGKTYLEDPTWWCLRLVGRLSPDLTRAQGVAQLQSAFQNAAYIGLGNPAKGEERPVLSFQTAKGFPGYDDQYGKPLRMLTAMVGLVLLIALSNVTTLLIARNTTRQREFALRLALGAGGAQLFRQLIAESLWLVMMGGAMAWAFATSATGALGAWAGIESSLAPDNTVLFFTLAVLCIAALLFGLAPLREAITADRGLDLKTSAATSLADTGKTRTGRVTIALQMALCLVLLAGAGLLIRTLQNLQHIPLGFQPEGLVVFDVDPLQVHSTAETRAFYQNLLNQLRVLPGVESVTIMENRLGSGWSNNRYATVDGKRPDVASGASTLVRSNSVGPDFFHTLGIPLLAGRQFTDADNGASAHVAIVNELFVKRFLANRNPLGHRIGGNNGSNDDAMIVGVVKDHKYRSLDEAPIPMAWYPYTQNQYLGSMTIEMRVRGHATAILPSVHKVLQQIDPNLPLIKPLTQWGQFEESISRQILFARLAECFGLLGIVLVGTGLYGTLAYSVSRRTAEIGLRMAVGAPRKRVVWMVLKDSLLLTAVGAGLGAPLAMLAAHMLESVLYGVTPWDALSYLMAILGVAAVALIASIIPARRAASIDPLTALRME
ncbi:MAG TPA: ABC transporter permease [Bryobacteraceae bacterium]|jgi:predicted permease|nr:ABC transporter permease [Bryobacteraceae bacterium]